MEKEIRQLIIEFMTKTQIIDYGKNSTATFRTWKKFYINFIDSIPGYEAYWDSIDDSISIFFEHIDLMSIKFDQDKKTFWLESEHWQTDEPELRLLLGKTVMQILNATACWETEELQKYEIYEQKESISIFLSLTSVKLTTDESKTIQGILKRMAEDQGYVYEKMENVSFEIELRSEVGQSTKQKQNQEEKEEEEEEESNWDWL